MRKVVLPGKVQLQIETKEEEPAMYKQKLSHAIARNNIDVFLSGEPIDNRLLRSSFVRNGGLK